MLILLLLLMLLMLLSLSSLCDCQAFDHYEISKYESHLERSAFRKLHSCPPTCQMWWKAISKLSKLKQWKNYHGLHHSLISRNWSWSNTHTYTNLSLSNWFGSENRKSLANMCQFFHCCEHSKEATKNFVLYSKIVGIDSYLCVLWWEYAVLHQVMRFQWI